MKKKYVLGIFRAKIQDGGRFWSKINILVHISQNIDFYEKNVITKNVPNCIRKKSCIVIFGVGPLFRAILGPKGVRTGSRSGTLHHSLSDKIFLRQKFQKIQNSLIF